MARGKRVSCLTKNVLLLITMTVVPNYINVFLANATNNLITAFQEEKNGNEGILQGKCFDHIHFYMIPLLLSESIFRKIALTKSS